MKATKDGREYLLRALCVLGPVLRFLYALSHNHPVGWVHFID